ncbi:MAG TPA: hypothetical protein VL126_07490 [Bacteroidota bacterium]|nr:hypothetical protein [Bacteroidota bacterium]
MKSLIRMSILQLLLLPLLAFSCRDGGSHGNMGERVVLPAGEVHQGWYFAGGNNVIIDGTVNGDAFIAAGLVEVTGTINGELFVAGGQVDVSGHVADRVIAAGGVVRLTGKTDKSVVAAGGTVILARGGSVGVNLLGAGGTLIIDGTVAGESRVAGGEVDLSGEVKGNLAAACDRFRSDKGAVVGGNLTIEAKDSTHIAVAQGTARGVTSVNIRREEPKEHFLGLLPAHFVFRLLYMLSLFLCALVLSFLFPEQTAAIGTTITLRPGQSALVGIATLILAPVLAIVLCCTVIGLPLAMFVMAYYLWLLYLSQLSLGVALGFRLMRFDGKRGWELFGVIALGLLIVDVLQFIPIVNVLVILAGLILGVGSLAIITQEQYLSLRTP